MDIKEYFKVGEVFTYFFRKKDPNAAKPSIYMRMMYGANKISIIVFLVCLIVILYRLFIRQD